MPRSAHASGTLDAADAILAAHPDLAAQDVYLGAILGDADSVVRLVAGDARIATTRGGLYGWDPLTYLCFSQYLRLRPADSFVVAAEALLDAGVDPNTGFYEPDHLPEPTFESALYGAAGVAHHAGLTRLLLARGADPNLGGEVAYHAAEGFDSEAMEAVVESGRLSSHGLSTMLARKLDWTDQRGVRWLLEHGADANALSDWGDRPLHHALARDNTLALIELLIEFGADPALGAPVCEGPSAVAMAARRARADVLELFGQSGYATALDGDDAFFAAIARGDDRAARALMNAEPGIVDRLGAETPDLVTTLAGVGNTDAVELALDLGFPLCVEALPGAVWRGWTDTVAALLARGAPVPAEVLALAERAQTEMSEWTPHRSREILDLLHGAARQ